MLWIHVSAKGTCWHLSAVARYFVYPIYRQKKEKEKQQKQNE